LLNQCSPRHFSCSAESCGSANGGVSTSLDVKMYSMRSPSVRQIEINLQTTPTRVPPVLKCVERPVRFDVTQSHACHQLVAIVHTCGVVRVSIDTATYRRCPHLVCQASVQVLRNHSTHTTARRHHRHTHPQDGRKKEKQMPTRHGDSQRACIRHTLEKASNTSGLMSQLLTFNRCTFFKQSTM
jgi:hypothetical protein